MKNDLDNEVNKKNQKSICITSTGQCNTGRPLERFFSDFYIIRHGEGVAGLQLHAKLHGCGFKNVGLQASKQPKLLIFGIILPKGGIFFFKIWHGEGLPGSHPPAKLYRFGLVDVGLRPPKIAKNGNFWYKFSPKGYIPLSHFYKILPGGGSPKTAPACQISPLQL